MRKGWVYCDSGDGLPMAGLDRGLVRRRGNRERGKKKNMFLDISASVFSSVVTFRPPEILSPSSVSFALHNMRAVIAHIQCSLLS